jgi:hypothetical protein
MSVSTTSTFLCTHDLMNEEEEKRNDDSLGFYLLLSNLLSRCGCFTSLSVEQLGKHPRVY